MPMNFHRKLPIPQEVKKESKHLSFVFFTFAASYVVSLIFILTLNAFLYAVSIPQRTEYIIRSILSAIHTPLIFFIMYKVFKKSPSAILPIYNKMSFSKLVKFLLVCIFLMISGSLVGNFVTGIISSLTGNSVGSVVYDIVKTMKPLEVFIIAVVAGPVFEELVFRKLLIDKLARYGTAFACIVSALVFGLYHGNFEQFFYAFFVGTVLSYVYCVYGKIMVHCKAEKHTGDCYANFVQQRRHPLQDSLRHTDAGSDLYPEHPYPCLCWRNRCYLHSEIR